MTNEQYLHSELTGKIGELGDFGTFRVTARSI
jgi:hypothetical protein